MRQSLTILIIILSAAIAAVAQPDAAPQTARQALLEMFFSKTPGTFEKHLPEAMRAALHKADTGSGMSMLQQFSLLSSQLSAQGQQLQTFEAGSTLVAVENTQTATKFELSVEHDDLRSDEDEIELSFRTYKEGQIQKAPVFPRMTFLMKSEKGIWRLNELTFSIRVSLNDPELIKTMMAGMQQRQMQSGMQAQSMGQNQIPANDAGALTSLRAIVTAEMTYAMTYPNVGYTCSLSDLDGFGGGTPNEHQAMLIESRLASGKKNGYIFTLSGCDGPPGSHFRLAAVPAIPDAGLRAFCVEQSGAIRYSADGNAATCLGAGIPLQ
jgi:hypothetical protein